MLFDEFLKGTNTTENDWTLSEYARINKLYMESDTMTKAEAYSLYNEPDQLIKDLMDDKATYKAEFLKARKQQRAEHEELLALKIELNKEQNKSAALERELFKIKESAHNLYYAAGII